MTLSRRTSRALAVTTTLAIFLGACAPKEPAGIPADFRIALDRGPCFGTCPVYTITVSADGSLTYDGRQFVDVVGEQTASLQASEVQELVDAVIAADFFSLADTYTVPATDLPSITMVVTLNGRTKSVYHYGLGCGTDLNTAPSRLCDLEARLENIPRSNGWVSNS